VTAPAQPRATIWPLVLLCLGAVASLVAGLLCAVMLRDWKTWLASCGLFYALVRWPWHRLVDSVIGTAEKRETI